MPPPAAPFRLSGRYALYDRIASGGMASVHLGRLLGPVGFSRTVAIKRLRSEYADDPEFVSMFLDEARIAGRVRHPNVAATVDVVSAEGELFLVMEYVHGDSFSRLWRAACDQGQRVAPDVALSIVVGTLYGLHAAHEAKSETGQPLGIVHRDVSPQNILVGLDGVARVIDFGVAKAMARLQTTREGQIKGKLGYMSPEQLGRKKVDRRSDVYSATVVLWEALTGRRLFCADDAGGVVAAVLSGDVDPPSRYADGLSRTLDDAVKKGLALDPDQRFESAKDAAVAFERALAPASAAAVGDWVERTSGDALRARANRVHEIESSTPEPAATDERGPEIALRISRERAELLERSEAPTDITGTYARSTERAGERLEHAGSNDSRSPVKSRKRWVGSVVAAIAFSGLALLVSRRASSPTAATPRGMEPQSSPPAAVALAEVNPAHVSASPPAVATPATSSPLVVAVSALSAAPSAPRASAPVAGDRHPPAIVRRAKRDVVPRACDPDYYFDERGIKHFKEWCFR